MKWFEYTQNNSGGSFVEDDKLCHRLFIEAKYATEAEFIATGMGVYFNGCEDDRDCSCCGDRWYRVDDSDALDFPIEFGGIVMNNIEEYAQHLADEWGWSTIDGRIFYKDGTVKDVKNGRR